MVAPPRVRRGAGKGLIRSGEVEPCVSMACRRAETNSYGCPCGNSIIQCSYPKCALGECESNLAAKLQAWPRREQLDSRAGTLGPQERGAP